MESYIVRIYKRPNQGAVKKIVGTVEDVSNKNVIKFQGINELGQALNDLPVNIKSEEKHEP